VNIFIIRHARRVALIADHRNFSISRDFDFEGERTNHRSGGSIRAKSRTPSERYKNHR
jgi:hypothetical protein